MKKETISKLFLFLILFIFIFQISAEIIEKNIEVIKTPEKITQDIKNTTKNLSIDFANSAKIPDQIAFLPKLLFNIHDEINFSELIIYYAILFLIFLIINQIMSTFEDVEDTTKILFSIILSIILGISGSITKISEIWIMLFSKISFFDKIGSITISFLIIGLLTIYILLKKFLTSIKESTKIAKATYEGMRAGTSLALEKAKSDVSLKKI